jgi:hypothetical protein
VTWLCTCERYKKGTQLSSHGLLMSRWVRLCVTTITV